MLYNLLMTLLFIIILKKYGDVVLRMVVSIPAFHADGRGSIPTSANPSVDSAERPGNRD